MGYCYQGKKLVCDICGTAGAKKYRCPFGWCQAIAACPTCRKTKKEVFSKEFHRERGCEKSSNEFNAKLQKEQDMLDAGQSIRCSALSVDNGDVHVLFRKKDGSCEGKFMSQETYRAIPIGEIATPEDYAKLGEIRPAPAQFYNGSTTKQVK